jgi:hypothetical protein
MRHTRSNCDWRAERAMPYNMTRDCLLDAAANGAAMFGGNR